MQKENPEAKTSWSFLSVITKRNTGHKAGICPIQIVWDYKFPSAL
jgi:hypothetical protein